ncbi:MAG: sulfatase-like hydrolase/transferase [Ilumatobacter sp.]
MTKSLPNILLIMSDQHKPKMAGYAGNTVVSTPHLDRLAQRGTSFSSAYCTSPMCSCPGEHRAKSIRPRNRRVGQRHPYVGGSPVGEQHLGQAGYRVTTIGKLRYRDLTDDTGFPAGSGETDYTRYDRLCSPTPLFTSSSRRPLTSHER